MAADTYHWQNTGTGLFAYYSNIPWEAETIPPGTYFETYVDASSYVSNAADTIGNGVCVSYWSFTIDKHGDWVDGPSYGACGPATTLKLDKQLGTGRVVASIPIVDCTAWDKETGECVGDLIEVGTFGVNLTLTGTGPIFRNHGTSSGGTAGYYQSTYHGTGTNRSATPAGSVTLNGASIIGGATTTGGSLWSSRDGGVDITVCNPRTGC
jgi:hypothetical protein